MGLQNGEIEQVTSQAIADSIVTEASDDAALADPAASDAGDAARGRQSIATTATIETALSSQDMDAAAAALIALVPLFPLGTDAEMCLDKRMQALIASGTTEEHPGLSAAIARLIYERSRASVGAAIPFIPALLSFLELDISSTGAYSYYTLMIVASDGPDHLGPFVGTLIGKLASPSYTARTFAARIITELAGNRPEYVADARDALRNLSECCPEGILKAEATKAYQAILSHARPDDGGATLAAGEAPVRLRETPARAVTDAAAGPRPAVAGFAKRPGGGFDSIAAVFQEIVRTIGRKERDREEFNLIVNNMQDIAKWIETEFPNDDLVLKEKVNVMSSAGINALLAAHAAQEPAMDDAAPEQAPEPAPSEAEGTAETTPEEKDKPTKEGYIPISKFLDEAETEGMRNIMEEIESDFSATASKILEAMGMEHMKARGAAGAEDRKIGAKEFVSAMEKIIREQKNATPDLALARDYEGAQSPQHEAKALVKEIKRCIDNSLPASAKKPAVGVAESLIKSAEDKRFMKTVSYNTNRSSGKDPGKQASSSPAGAKKYVIVHRREDRKK